MNILDHLEDQKSRQAYYASRESAIDYFDQQKSALDGIKDTLGFKEIKNYWLRQLEACLVRFEKAKGDELIRLQGSISEINQFLDFLTKITEPDTPSE